MKLSSAARFFDDTPVYDGYTGQFLWNCQFSTFNDTHAIGSTSTRRILSIAPGLAIPSRRVLQIFDTRWLVGDGNPDSWRGKVIRQSFNMQKATSLAELLTPAQACLDEAGTLAYTQGTYFKDTVNALNNADYDPYWNFFFAPSENVSRGTFIRSNSQLYRVRSTYLPLENLRIGGSDTVDTGPLDAVFQTGAFNALADSFDAGTVETKVVMFDFTKAYSYLTQASERVAAGDMNALVPASALTPEAGKTVTISGVNWRILGIDTEGDCWLLHLRRA